LQYDGPSNELRCTGTEVSGLTVVSVVAGIVLVIGLVIAIAYVISLIGPRFFGDDPGGRDPDIRGQFLMWVIRLVTSNSYDGRQDKVSW